MANPSSEARCECGETLVNGQHADGVLDLEEHFRRCYERQRAEVARLLDVIAKAPHGFACLSFTIIEGPYPTYRDAPPQVYRPRLPPDESLCNCWKRAALAAPAAPAKAEVPPALEWSKKGEHLCAWPNDHMMFEIDPRGRATLHVLCGSIENAKAWCESRAPMPPPAASKEDGR